MTGTAGGNSFYAMYDARLDGQSSTAKTTRQMEAAK